MEDGRKSTAIFTGVRHPNFPDDDAEDGYDPGCRECGARAGYRCTCDDEPWTCDECGERDEAYGCHC